MFLGQRQKKILSTSNYYMEFLRHKLRIPLGWLPNGKVAGQEFLEKTCLDGLLINVVILLNVITTTIQTLYVYVISFSTG